MAGIHINCLTLSLAQFLSPTWASGFEDNKRLLRYEACCRRFETPWGATQPLTASLAVARSFRMACAISHGSIASICAEYRAYSFLNGLKYVLNASSLCSSQEIGGCGLVDLFFIFQNSDNSTSSWLINDSHISLKDGLY